MFPADRLQQKDQRLPLRPTHLLPPRDTAAGRAPHRARPSSPGGPSFSPRSCAASRRLDSCREAAPPSVAVSPDCHGPSSEMASFPGLFKAVGPAEEENGELDGSLQQMLKAIADERSRLNLRQEVSGLGESVGRSVSVACSRGPDRTGAGGVTLI